jgi:HAMP domain-containing protein
MLNRLTVSGLVKAVIILMAIGVVTAISVSAWESWARLQQAGRISVVAEISANLFKAMHTLRTDRASTNRALNAERAIDADSEKYLRAVHDSEVPALRSAVALLPSVDFNDKATLLPALSQLVEKLTAQQAQAWDAARQPKASRPATLAKDYMATTAALLETLDKLTAQLTAAVNHNDPVIDQLLSIKQNAWLLRDTAGEASIRVSTAMSNGGVTPEVRQAYVKFTGGIQVAWNALELATSGMQLPASLTGAMAAAKSAYFDPQYTSLRDRLIEAVANGEKTEITADQFTPITVGRMGSAITVGERALEEAKGHTLAQWSAARLSLILQLLLLASALVLAFGSVMLVNRRVIKPLHAIRDAMLKVAAGDLSVDAGHTQRHDEIGALAGALGTFKQQAVEKARIEQQERERNAGASSRQQAIEGYIADFEDQVRRTLRELGDASNAMRSTSDGMAAVSGQTNASVHVGPDQCQRADRRQSIRGGFDQRAERGLGGRGAQRLDR